MEVDANLQKCVISIRFNDAIAPLAWIESPQNPHKIPIASHFIDLFLKKSFLSADKSIASYMRFTDDSSQSFHVFPVGLSPFGTPESAADRDPSAIAAIPTVAEYSGASRSNSGISSALHGAWSGRADPISAELWKRKNWTIAIEQYCRFLCLMSLYPDRPLVPTPMLDQVWHVHILDTQRYRRDCLALFGQFIDHQPFGTPALTPHTPQTPTNLARSRHLLCRNATTVSASFPA
ncbi:MAG: hypothetical protein HC795_12465 [Coleofasciculaceae cyanobacterium RL_1_1]|nr:hypothetical protein [Coleofasciculaceae cyanobacterium RL_1_1]